MERLTKIGFKRVGSWCLEDGKLSLSLTDEASSKNVLYSFVSNEEILYIGKTVQPLHKRMYGYQNPGPSQTTNIKNNSFITEKLSSGGSVEFYVLPDSGLLQYGGYHLNLAAGLEDSLISKIDPPWNRTGKALEKKSLGEGVVYE